MQIKLWQKLAGFFRCSGQILFVVTNSDTVNNFIKFFPVPALEQLLQITSSLLYLGLSVFVFRHSVAAMDCLHNFSSTMEQY